MPFYHSSYSVIVQMVESDHLELDKNNGSMLSHQLTWPQLCGVSRVSGHAAKEVMLCFVIPPADMTIDELSSPKCITRYLKIPTKFGTGNYCYVPSLNSNLKGLLILGILMSLKVRQFYTVNLNTSVPDKKWVSGQNPDGNRYLTRDVRK
ncbi:uncharacterized protein [Acropora muricata]|uniref:uncharacterized protein n=1 Tax=Acropora muricata TaxID=159855 RepID=UPI0034E50F78